MARLVKRSLEFVGRGGRTAAAAEAPGGRTAPGRQKGAAHRWRDVSGPRLSVIVLHAARLELAAPLSSRDAKQNLNESRSRLGKLAERGMYGATRRGCSTAIEQISSILAEEEPREVGYMLANLDERDRICRKDGRVSGTRPSPAAASRSRRVQPGTWVTVYSRDMGDTLASSK
jgi:hypothetical protein